jgi:Peroxidase, family 2
MALPRPTPIPLKRGSYSSATSSDLRSPCPVINSLANHGYLPRDGRDVQVNDFTTALKEIGLSSTLRAFLSNPIFLEKKQSSDLKLPKSLFGRIWYKIRNPWSILFSKFGMRNPGQVDSMGNKCLNLDQLALHGAVEHDVSLTRLDFAQGDNFTIQPGLLKGLLAASSDGGTTLTAQDLASLRKRRIERQRETNQELTYGPVEHQAACGEIALILKVFGDGKSVPCVVANAVFEEERLPIQEGWKKRWFSVGLLEFVISVEKIKQLIGLKM